MNFRSGAVIGSILTLGLCANPGGALPPFRSHLPSMPFGNTFQPPLRMGFTPMSTLPAATAIPPTTATPPLRTVPGVLSSARQTYYQALRNYEKALWNYDRAVWRYDLRHGYNPYAYYPSSYYPYAYNPSAGSSPYSYNPYSYATYPYGASSYGGSSYASSSSYGNSTAASNPAAQGYGGKSASEADTSKGKPQATPLAAFGIPNDNGAVQWPLAFRALLPERQREIRQKLDAQLPILATQAVIGKANPNLLKEATRGVDQLNTWLRDRRLDMPEGTFRDAQAFLRKLDEGLQAMGSY